MIKKYNATIKSIFFLLATAIILYSAKTKMNNISTVTIGFTGDVMLGRTVNKMLKLLETPTRYRYPWGTMLPFLKKNDINIINLETTLTTSDDKVEKVFNYKADPDLANALTEANVTVACLANNHIYDFGSTGLTDTITALDNAGTKHVGAGENISQAKKPVIIKKNGITIGIIGYTDNEPTWLATDEKSGTNYIAIGDIETVKKDIEQVRKNVDVLILSIHWGPNKRTAPTQKFVAFAHKLVDAGIDIIHGHSAHLVQGLEVYKNKLIMYDTGDFVDDYARYDKERNDWTALFNVTITKDGPIKLELIPAIIANYQVNHATGQEYSKISQHFAKLSRKLGSKLENNKLIIKKKQ